MARINYNINTAIRSMIKIIVEDPTETCVKYFKSHLPDKLTQRMISTSHALASVALGTWSFDFKTKVLQICPQCRALLGLPVNELISTDLLTGLVTSEQAYALVKAITTARSQRLPLHIHFPVISHSAATGQQRWLQLTGLIRPADERAPEKFNGTLADISQRVNQEVCLQDLMAVVNHEMRSPLSSIKLYLQLCRTIAQNGADERLLKFLDRSNEMVDKAVAMLDYFQKGPALQTGRLLLAMAEFDMNELLIEMVDNFRFIQNTHQIILRTGPGILIRGDRERIAQVIQNLLTNAIKYSPDPYAIVIKSTLVQNGLEVTVKDHGIGIAREDQGMIFEKYYRVDNKLEKAIAGHGIGLYLCKIIISEHQGEIGLKSDDEKGSTFFFRLPLP